MNHFLKLFSSAMLLCVALAAIGCRSTKNIKYMDANEDKAWSGKFVGTAWQMMQTVQGLDAAPTITWNRTLKFIDKTHVEMVEENDYSGYSDTYKNEDGNVGYHPGFTESNVKKGTYVAKGKQVTVTLEGEKEELVFHLSGNKLIYNVSEEEYNAMQPFEREYYTYKRQ